MMAKTISTRVGKRIRKSAKALEKSLDAVRPGARASGTSKARIAGMAGAAVAGAAGVAAAVRKIRRGDSNRNATTLHVVREGEGWAITADGREDPVEKFDTKKEAVRAARTTAAESAPSDLVIHRADGSVEESHSYESA